MPKYLNGKYLLIGYNFIFNETCTPEHNTSVESSNPVDIIYIYVPLFQGELDFILISEKSLSQSWEYRVPRSSG